jgi:dynein light chain roadblock-type
MADTEPPPSVRVLAAAAVPSSKSKANYAEVQETVSRLAAHKGVTAVLILNRAGDILTQTGQGSVGNPKLLKQTLDAAAHYVQSIPSEDDDESEAADEGTKSDKDVLEKLSFVRIRTKREEILVAPKNQYVLVVLQDPNLAPL